MAEGIQVRVSSPRTQKSGGQPQARNVWAHHVGNGKEKLGVLALVALVEPVDAVDDRIPRNDQAGPHHPHNAVGTAASVRRPLHGRCEEDDVQNSHFN